MSSVYWDTFSSSFPVWIPLLFFPVWLLWLEVPIQCWIATVKAGIFVLFLILRGKTLAFYHWVLCYLWGFCQRLYLWWGSSVLFLVFWVFLSWRVLIFSNAFSGSVETSCVCGGCVWGVCVCFQLLWGITLTAFFMLNHFCTPAVNHTWSQCVIF